MPQVEIDKVLRFVRHVAAEVAANDTVPRGIVFLVELKEKRIVKRIVTERNITSKSGK